MPMRGVRSSPGGSCRRRQTDGGGQCRPQSGFSPWPRRAAARIAVGASVLTAFLPDEPEAAACAEALDTGGRIVISAATVADVSMGAERRGIGTETAGLVDGFQLEIATVSRVVARRVAGACARWGKGVHPAGLNFGDCFACEVAWTRGCPLLHVGADFARTDIAGAP